MATKLNTRLLQKRGSWSDWEKAVNFVPLRGEIIIYEADENHPIPRFKVGMWDGTDADLTADKYVNALPFASDPDVISDTDIDNLF